MPDHGVPVVFDNSNPKKTKAGFAGENTPRLVFPSIVARQRVHAVCNPPPPKDLWVGNEVLTSRNPLLTTAHAMSPDGAIPNPDNFEHLWRHAYSNLSVESEGQPVLVVDRSLFAPGARETMAQIAFESFSVPGLYVAHADGLEVGIGTGVSVYSGEEGYVSAVPVVDEVVMGHAAVRVGLGDGEGGGGLGMEAPYTLPDGNVVALGNEGVKAMEALFTGGSDIPGIGSAVSAAVRKCDRHVRRDILENVVFSGGNSRFPGFQLRLQRELQSLFPDWNVCVRPPADLSHSAWVGGSMLASLSTFRAMTITYAEYDETGPTMVYRKCF